MLLFCIVLIVSSVKGSSSNTVVTYTNKTIEVIPCVIDEKTVTASWRDVSTDNFLYTYIITSPDIEERDLQPKHENFRYSLENTSFNLIIDKLERDDEGTYSCDVTGQPSGVTLYYITVEAIPDEFSLDCFVPPAVTCPAQGMNPTSELICTCAAKGVHPGTLSLNISGTDNVQQDSTAANDGLFDLSLTATVPVTESTTEVTCSVNGYNTTEPIPPNLITKTLMISPPTCALDISFDQDCKGATLNCSCSAIPTDGKPPSDSGMVFSYFNGAGDLIAGNATIPVQINDVEAGLDLTYSCRGCNGLYYGDSSYVTESKVCTISTTALPTTTIVTTAPLSTNEPTSTKATDATTSTMHTEDSTMVTTSEEPKDDNPKNPESGGLTAGAIVGISLGVVAVVVVIVVVAVIMCKKGEDDSKPSDSSVADGNVTATNINITSSEPPAPVYGVVKKDSKKKSDKPDNNGAPTYGTNDKNITKDQAPAPHSSMRDSTNSPKPKQDMEMQYADIDHGNKPPSDEVRKPNKEPTEYATVQPVIV